ncbi:hypothetical protein C942_03047 [Photobacterium marinum]|uniref:Uncharacterized protein n=1 Tax=Photobacterium marinum TaxID=1056511 RepID=L8J6Z5_9GAMM|nr:hypothetical protein C942_03047 [Photobacterium marinum]
MACLKVRVQGGAGYIRHGFAPTEHQNIIRTAHFFPVCCKGADL